MLVNFSPGKRNRRSQFRRLNAPSLCEIADSSKKGIVCARFMKPSGGQNVTLYVGATGVQFALVAEEEKVFPWAHPGS
jgi:hypothetical protein